MALCLSAGVHSDIGGYRDVNQDAAFVAPWGAGVADGVGGGPAGDLASDDRIAAFAIPVGPLAAV